MGRGGLPFLKSSLALYICKPGIAPSVRLTAVRRCGHKCLSLIAADAHRKADCAAAGAAAEHGVEVSALRVFLWLPGLPLGFPCWLAFAEFCVQIADRKVLCAAL